MFFTYAIETVVIAMGALMALDMGTRIATAYISAVTGRTTASGAITPAPQQDTPQRLTAPAEYTVEYVAYCGATHTIEPVNAAAVKRESIITTNGWLEADTLERPLPPRRILGDVIKSKSANKLSDLIRSEAARPKDGIVERLDHTFNLPDSIRGLRQYVRDNGLQKQVKAYTGKTVSRATKAELLEALANI